MASIQASPFHQAFMGEAVFGASDDDKPVLATDGLRTCIGFAGWDPEEKIGFLAHFAGPKQVDGFYSEGVKRLLALSKKTNRVFECALIGGYERAAYSREIVEKIKAGLDSVPNTEFRIIHEEPPTPKYVLKSLSLDLRDGKFGSYNSEEDPEPREKTESYLKRAATFDATDVLDFP